MEGKPGRVALRSISDDMIVKRRKVLETFKYSLQNLNKTGVNHETGITLAQLNDIVDKAWNEIVSLAQQSDVQIRYLEKNRGPAVLKVTDSQNYIPMTLVRTESHVSYPLDDVLEKGPVTLLRADESGTITIPAEINRWETITIDVWSPRHLMHHLQRVDDTYKYANKTIQPSQNEAGEPVVTVEMIPVTSHNYNPDTHTYRMLNLLRFQEYVHRYRADVRSGKLEEYRASRLFSEDVDVLFDEEKQYYRKLAEK